MKIHLALLFTVTLAATVFAQDSPSAQEATAPEGLLPTPDYSGDIWSSSYLTGDWDGQRTDLANKGIQLDMGWTQTLQSVVDGGRETDTRYGGSLDYLVNLDLQRMGVMPGALVKIRGESRYGESVNGIAGPVLPASLDGLFPLESGLDNDIGFTVTALTYVQFLSETLCVVLGKTDTLDGDLNEFASGRGNSQFMNGNFVFSPVIALTVPYSTLAAGVLWMPSENVTLTSSMINTSDSSTSSGFDDIGEGWTWSSELLWQYRLGELPGGQTFGFVYAGDNQFATLGTGRLTFQPGEGLSFATDSSDDTWAAYWSLWQYLWTEEPAEGKIDLANGRPDHQGVGLFLRAGLADQDVNPIEWTFSGGLGGRGVIPTRDDDTFGIAYFYTKLQTSRFTTLVGVDDKSHGFEAFYNMAVTPATHLTFDVQALESPLSNQDTSIVLGLRLQTDF